MRITIIGPGALGLLFYSFLSSITENIILLDKDTKRASLLKHKGLTVDRAGEQKTFKLNITANPKQIKKPDLIIICVKAYDTQAAANSARLIADKHTCVLSLQNGIGNLEILNQFFSKDRILAGISSQGSTLLKPGHIIHAGSGITCLGAQKIGKQEKLEQIAELFNQAGIHTEICVDINGVIWSKLLINVGINALTAILRIKNGMLIKNKFCLRLMKQAVDEAMLVAEANKIKLTDDNPIAICETVCRKTADNISSMLQDVLKGKNTEIEAINGAIYHLGQREGIATPINQLLYSMVKAIEQSYKYRL